jgi:hypothetical protein
MYTGGLRIGIDSMVSILAKSCLPVLDRIQRLKLRSLVWSRSCPSNKSHLILLKTLGILAQ